MDIVTVPSHGTPCGNPSKPCCNPSIITTDECSETVFSNGIGIMHIAHASIQCAPHQTPLDTYSPNVYIEGMRVGRMGDMYDSGGMFHLITTGSPNVFANGA